MLAIICKSSLVGGKKYSYDPYSKLFPLHVLALKKGLKFMPEIVMF